MDKIARLRQEIERRLNILTNVYVEQVERKDEEMMNYYHGKVIALEELLSFLDTLSEEPDKSLKDEAINYCFDKGINLSPIQASDFARHFAEWGVEHLRDSTKMIDKSLEEAAEDYIMDNIPDFNPEFYDGSLFRDEDMNHAFIAGWKCRDDQMPMPEDTVLFNKGVAEGRRLEREDMLKDAIEWEVIANLANRPVIYLYQLHGFKPGDKVKVIVLKDNEDESK